MSDIYERLTPIFHDVFDNDDVVVTPELTAEDVSEWDSLSHIRLMVAIEAAFGMSFTTAEVTSFKNVGELAACIESRKTK